MAVLVAAGAVRWRSSRRLHIDAAHCALIKPGIPLREVEDLLGGPPGNYTTGPVMPGPRSSFPAFHETDRWAIWVGDEATVTVVVDEQGRAREASISPNLLLPPRPWYDRLRDLFR